MDGRRCLAASFAPPPQFAPALTHLPPLPSASPPPPPPRGQSVKVFSQLLRKARQRGFLVPVVKPKGVGPNGGGGPGGPGEGVGYEGATVLEPKIGGRGLGVEG